MDKEQQRAATKKGGQQPRGGVIKNVIAEVKEDVVKTVAYVWQGSSNLFDAFQLPSASRFVEQAFAPYLLTSTITA
ncbi:unnamed protein product [Sphagnum troendelagicum]|uniref:Uncharacterized protein n=1 Tax=Sphagnum troendelagicum TaxID=128251 RepID=A0ABP0U0J0_9BRYO